MISPLRHVPKVEARAAVAALIVGIVFLAVKFVAYVLTGSAVIFSDAMESIVNVAASSFALVSLAYAHRPADSDHPYGHGKIEFLSAGFEGVTLAATAVLMVIAAIRILVLGSTPAHIESGLILVGAAMVAHAALGLYLIGVGRRQQSITLEADGRHLLSDAVTSVVAVVVLLVVHWTHWAWADPVAALMVAVYVAAVGIALMRRSTAGLMDEQDEADNATLRTILDAHLPGGAKAAEAPICSYHKLRHRHSGRYHWVDFHMVVPGWWDVAASHKLASTIEYEIEQVLGQADATAHIEPCVNDQCPCHSAART